MSVIPAMFEIGLGQTLGNSLRVRWIPYVGYRLLELSPRNRNDERYKGFSLLDHAPTAGVVADFTFSHNTHNTDRSEDSFWFIRTKLSYSPVLAPSPFAGGLINLQIGIGGFGRPRKVSYQPQPTVIAVPDKPI